MLTYLNWQEKVEIIIKQVQNHFTPSGIVVIKKTENNKCWRGGGRNGNPHMLLGRMQNGAVTSQDSLAVPPKVKRRYHDSTPWCTPGETKTPQHYSQ